MAGFGIYTPGQDTRCPSAAEMILAQTCNSALPGALQGAHKQQKRHGRWLSSSQRMYKLLLCWVNLGWSCSIAPPPQLDNYKRLVGRGRDRERPLTNYYHSQNRLDSRKLIFSNQIRLA